jgi:putative SOS response-associated peptidase YedK
MCGRYVVAFDPQALVDGFSVVRVDPFPRRWNVAPQSVVPVVHETREGERVATPMRWGLVPHWAKDPAIGHKLNNARAEGVAGKPSFRQALRRRRCLIPASGFYEWQPAAEPRGRKQPWYFSAAPGSPLAMAPGLLAMAGLFEAWRPAEGADWLLSCCIVTTEANATMAPVHDRMPVLLAPQDWARWLDRREQDPATVQPLLRPCPEGWLQAWKVSRAVSPGSAEGEALVAPLAEG